MQDRPTISERLDRLEDRVFEAATKPSQANAAQPMSNCGRPGAREIIDTHIKRLRQEADSLTALSEALPMVMSPEADAALWELVSSRLCR